MGVPLDRQQYYHIKILVCFHYAYENFKLGSNSERKGNMKSPLASSDRSVLR